MRADDVITEFVPPPERPFLETPVPRSRWIVASVVAVAFSLIAWTLTPTPTTQRIDTAVSSGNLVMVTGNGAYNLNSDSDKKTLFEAFGWTVTAIDDNSSAGAFAAAAAANDVMYLSDSTSNAGDDVRDLDIGLLVEDHGSFNEVLYSGGSSIPWSVDVAMDIVDTGHYITSGLSLGNLTIYGTSDYVSYWNAGSIALPSGVEVLADSISNTNYAALMVAETGAALLSSQTAANRRVWVPTDLTDASSFNSTYESLLERSLEWAAGFDATPTVTVNSTGDGVDSNIGDNICSTGGTNSSGATECTLRAAIAEANASSIVNTIEFAMPTGEAGYTGAWWNIAVGTSELPEIVDDVTIDGSTQTGYSSSPLVVIDGSTITSPTDGDGIRVTSGAVTLRALSVVDAPGDGIDHGGTGSVEDSYAGLLPDGTADGNGEDGIRVTGSNMTLSGNTSSANNTGIRVAADTTTLVSNKIGTNPAGDAARGNLTVGLRIESGTPLTIGGIGVGNVISANGRDGVWFTGGSSIVVEGNNIGVAADGTTPMANGSASNYEAIDLTGATGTVRIGGTAAGAGNTLYGSGDGVRVTGSVTATILGNSISNSTGLGIDLNDDGVTANDAGDGDSGPNDLLNFPVITDSDEAAGTVSVDYQLDAPAGNYRIEFFENPSGAGTGGYGEGQNFVHGVTVTHGGTGVESFSTSYSGAGSVPLTATATQDLGGGSYGATSEFSLAITTCSDGDGDGLCSHLEALLGDTDGDATANSADSDDDNDTTLTGSESADPNGDGDPRDALDSDRDGQPDYLDQPSDSTTGLAVGEQKISETTGGGPDLDGDDRFGRGVAVIGDIDGDGIVDAAIGASDGDDGGTDRGEVHVLLLNADGTVKTSQKISDTDGGLARSLADGDEFGRSVAGLGDLDGDAIPDLAVGTPGIDDGGTDRGAVHILFLNSDGTVKAETTISQSGGGGPGLGNSDGFGTSVAGLGDLNGDGLPDLAVGIAGDDDGGAQRGAAMVLFLNADGSAASTQKISSTTGGLTGTLDDGDGFGTAVAGPGDVDGDGVADVVVGATADDDGGPNRGAVYVLLLKTDGTVRAEQKISSTAGGFTGPLVDGDLFGVGVAGVGDLDRDGVPDLAVGAHTDDGGSDRGAVHLLFLNPDGSVGDEQRISDTGGGLAASLVDGDRFGSAIGSLGDLDGDGTPSLLIGADGDNDGASGTGAAYVLELNGGCSLGTGYGSTCPFASLDAVPVTADGRFWFDFGNGPFEASVDSDEGGRWLLVLQYHHLGGTNPALDVRSTTDDWPRYAPPVLGVDRSPTEWWGHTGQAAAAAIPDAATDLELRWAASTANHSRVIHFRSPVLGEFQTDAADDFNTGGLNTNFTALTGHTANVPAGLSNGYSNQGDLALTAFPFFATGAYHWGVRGNGDRWEVDDYVGGFGQNTVHQVWVRNGRIPAVVNSSGDGADANPGDSVCDTGGTNSDGETECTLRAAIEEANAAVLIDTIHFDIPTSDGGHSSGVWTIRPSSALPTISTAITVDGSTQPGWSADPVIALRADLAGSVALTVSAADSAIRSLVIHDQTGTGISLTGADRTVVAGSWIGLDPAGAADGGTVGVAVVGGTDVVIGGTTAVDRNVISGNGTDGVQVSGSPSGVTVRGNFIGTAADGTTNRGNGGSGVAITGGSDTAIGGADAGAGNTIAYNTDGVSITGSNDNPILGNSIHSNTGDGLDLGTANDNLTVPSPISAVVSGLVTDTIIDLDLPAGDYRLEFFANPSGVDPGGGEGETFRGAATITHTGSGVERFTPRVTGIAVDDVLTVTATEDAGGGNYGSTTEFSTSITAEAIVLPVLERIQSGTTILADGASIATANITAVEPTKAFTTFTIRGDDGDPNDFTVSGTLSDATTMTFQRSGTGGDMVIEWSVVEFASGVAVQRGSVSPTGSIENVTLTSVEPTRSFVLLSHHNNGSQFGADDFVAGWLSSDTNLVVSSLNATDAVTWQVVTYDGAIVRRGTTAMTSGEATVSPSVETVDPARSWLVYSMTSSAGTVSNIGQKMVRGRIVDGSTLSFDRDNSGQALDLYWEVIEFPEGVEVQHASVAFGSSASVVDVTIDEVFRGRSIAVGGRNLVGGRTPYAADDNPGVATFMTELTSGTNLRVRRDAASATAELGWFVLHWPCDDTDGDGLCDDAEDHNTDADDNPSTNPGPDTDGDGNADYLDADDDGDTIPTAAENPDPNGDGDPRDAADADRDRQPDYLDAPTTAARGRVGGEQKISDVVGGFGASLTDDAGFGGAAAPIGDLDGDGIVDVVVGSAGDDDGGSDRGAVHVLFLNANGTVKAEQKISDTVGGLTETLGDGDGFGSSVTGLGDLDGDGIPDIVVGAPGEDDGGTDSGAVYVLLLNANGTVKAEQNISTGSGGLTVDIAQDEFGASVAGPGDLNDDGLPDVVIGAPANDDGGADAGAAVVIFLNPDGTVQSDRRLSQSSGGLLAGLGAGNRFGAAATSLGDLDGGGTPDVAIGAPADGTGGTARGAAWVLQLDAAGAVTGGTKLADGTGGFLALLDDQDQLGAAVLGLGDIDHDGVPDLAVGADRDDDGGTDRGAIHVLLLNTDGSVRSQSKISSIGGALTGPLADGDRFGAAGAGIGDLNGDGRIDVIVGATGDDDGGSGRGAVYVLNLDAAADQDGDGLYDYVEDADTDADRDPSTNPGPNTDGDGLVNYLDADDDNDGVATASENADPNGDGEPTDARDGDRDGQPDYLDPATGRSLVRIAAEQKISDTGGGFSTALEDGDGFGAAAAAIGDLDGDGVVDAVVGVAGDDDGGTGRGAVFVLFLNADGSVKGEQKISDTTGGLVATLADGGGFGTAVAGLGDLDDDGINEVAVGAPDTGTGTVFVLFLNTDGTVRAEQTIGSGAGGLVAALDGNDRFGASVAAVDDVDGDGILDLAVGASGDGDGGSGHGAVHLLFLNADGSVKGERKISDTTGNLSHTFGTGEAFGASAAGLGDLDGDGTPDLLVGATGNDDGGTDRGALLALFLNADGSVKGEQRISDTTGGLPFGLADGANFGGAVSLVGDLDLDGVRDIAVGIVTDGDGGGGAGAVQVLHLNTNGTVKSGRKISATSGGLTGPLDAGDNFGTSVTGLGDLDGDGEINLLVGAVADDDEGPDRGAVYVLDLDPSVDSDGDGLWDHLEDGNTDADDNPATSPGPDTDGDGLADYLDADDDGDGISTALEDPDPNGDGEPFDAADTDRDGEPDYLDRGAGTSDGTVSIHHEIGDGSGDLIAALDTGDGFGGAAAPIGDLDGDGVVDVVVGAAGDDDGGTDRGAAYVLFLNADGTVKGEQKISDTTGGFTTALGDGDGFGSSVAGVGDLDRDGAVDVVVGAAGDDDGGTDRGAAYVLFLNADGSVKGEQKISDVSGGLAATLVDGDGFGASVAGVGDLDGDGLVDLVVGAAGDDNGGTGRGAAYVLFLNADGTVKGEQKISDTAGGLTAALSDGDGFGGSASGLGDVDGDGVADVVVGAAGDDDGGTDRGAAYVLFLNADGTVKGEQKISDTAGGLDGALADGDALGSATAGVGDLDDDGTVGLLLGASGRGGQGAVLVVDLAPTATATVADWSDRRSVLTAGGGLDVQVTAGGIVGRSLTYDGVDDRLIAPATDLVSGALTLSGWINATSFGTDPRVVAKADSAGSPVYELFVDDTSASTGGAVARIRLGGATFTVTGGSVTTGAWHHLATTWDGTTLSLYVDGQPVGSVVATGTLNTDATVPLTIGNLAAADRGFTGRIDEVRLSHTAASAAAVAFDYTNASNPGAVISVGGVQTAAADPWTISGTQTRSGTNAARAPEVSTTGRAAWLRATGIDEPGLEFRSWWWLSTTTGVDLAAGTRAGPVATNQYETAVTSSSGWDLATDVSGVRTQQAAPAGSPPTGSWVEVVLRTDESGNSAVVIGGSEVISSTAQGSGLLTGSAALRAGLLPSGQFWYVDDVRARKLIGAEPTVSLGPLERN